MESDQPYRSVLLVAADPEATTEQWLSDEAECIRKAQSDAPAESKVNISLAWHKRFDDLCPVCEPHLFSSASSWHSGAT